MTAEELKSRSYVITYIVKVWQEDQEPTYYTALTEERAKALGQEMIDFEVENSLFDMKKSWIKEGKIGFEITKCHALNEGLKIVRDDKRNLEEY